MERDIKEEILAASFYANWNYARELHKMKNSRAREQFDAAKEIQKEWLDHKQSKSTHNATNEITNNRGHG